MGAQHPLRVEIWSSKNVDMGEYDFTFRSLWLLDQSSLDFFAL